MKKKRVVIVLGLLISAGALYRAYHSRSVGLNEEALTRNQSPEQTQAGETIEGSITKPTVTSSSPSTSTSTSTTSSGTSIQTALTRDESGDAASTPSHPAISQVEPQVDPKNLVISPQDRAELSTFSWAGAGFKPPSTPHFDELFLKRSQNYKDTYSNKPFASGLYQGLFSQSKEALRFFFWAHLEFKELPNQGIEIQAPWWKWEDQPRRRYSTTDPVFHSPFEKDDSFDRILRMPHEMLTPVTAQAIGCKEISVLPHYDIATKEVIDSFNARVYCRNTKDRFEFLGILAFKLVSVLVLPHEQSP